MKIAIVVPGRFHALELAAALIARGHEVTVFTNYPPWAVRKFGLEPGHVRSIWILGIVERVIARFAPERVVSRVVWPFFQRALGSWAARQLSREHFDVIHEFSGVGEEVIRACRRQAKHLLMRASTHIRTQAEILREEAERTGIALAQPSEWIIAREEREYAAADYVVVPARFCRDSFVRQGVPEEKLLLLPFGVDTRKFELTEEMIERRCRRILSGAPLTAVTTGQVSFRKGLYDYAKIAAALEGRFRFRWIGVVREEAKKFVTRLPGSVELVPHQPQNSLPRVYAEADLFLLPTVEDGFPYVLMQAYANSLPLMTTPHCSGPDIIHEGKTGWVLRARDPEAFIDRLAWCDTHREELAQMVRQMTRDFRPRDWSDVAAEFESLCAQTAAV